MQEAQPTKYIIGADEVGYGCWAGPICVGAVCAPENWHMLGLNDSKQVTKKNREKLSEQLWAQHKAGNIFISVKMLPNTEIDLQGVAVCQKQLFVDTINSCYAQYVGQDIVAIVDGCLVLNQAILKPNYKSVVKADTKISTVMAASILAKVHRDSYMTMQSKIYPEYDFTHNVGYRSLKHEMALENLGPTPIHRMSYKVKAYQTYQKEK